MPVCNPPRASSLIGQTSTSCLQKFTIHFRRPEILKQNKNAPYKGEYGFDWLRDEYIYPIEWVFYDEVYDMNNPPLPINKYKELSLNPENLKKPGKINVIAKLGKCESEVGQLMVYQNNEIGKANIIVVNVITEYKNNKKVIPQSHPSLEYLLNYQSFNQAMIKAEIKAIENFDLVALSKNKNSKKMNDDDNVLHNVNVLLNEIQNQQFFKRDDAPEIIVEVISKAYSKYGKYVPKDIKNINEEGHYNTYLFFSTILCNADEGNSQVVMNKDETFVFGNMSLIFGNSLKKDFTIVHELGHSFSLPHTFQRDEKKYKPQHSFYEGYTENFMDYEKKYINPTVNSNFKNTIARTSNNYKDNMYSFYKWQWDTMRKDKSIKIMKRNN